MFVIIDFLGELQTKTQKAGYSRAKLSWDGDGFLSRERLKRVMFTVKRQEGKCCAGKKGRLHANKACEICPHMVRMCITDIEALLLKVGR